MKKENAEQWIKENKPEFSRKQIKSAINQSMSMQEKHENMIVTGLFKQILGL